MPCSQSMKNVMQSNPNKKPMFRQKPSYLKTAMKEAMGRGRQSRPKTNK